MWKVFTLLGCAVSFGFVFCDATATDATSTETSVGDVTATSEARCGYGSHPPKCGNNEVYNNCSNTACRPYLCSELGFPLKCDKKCKPGCICKDGYVRNDNGVCILINECPSCGGDKNAESGCGNNCGKTCDTYNVKSVVCTRCIVNGCNCRAGFVYDPNVKACVKPEDCTTCNGQNEYFENCIQGCSNQSCLTIGQIFHCPNQPAGQCKSGCRCKPGFFRDGNNVCVSQDDCPKPCGKNEYWEKCVSGCGNQTCDAIGVVWSCPLQKVWQCKGGCQCKPGHWRGPDNLCIPEKDCPPICHANEQYSPCTNGGCDVRNCSQIGKPVPCVKLAPESCIKGCICVDGHLRADNGTCVPKDQCPPSCGKNAYWEEPIRGCSDQTCATIGQSPSCLGVPGVRGGCRCKPGYWKLKLTDDDCVPENECPHPPRCGINEVYNNCTYTGCVPQHCSELGFPLKCENKCKPGCVCKGGYVRNDKGDCILINDCPSCGGNKNAQHGCSNYCGQSCSDYNKPPKPCSLFCKFNGCKCRPGFVYDYNVKTCVRPKDCSPEESTSISTTTVPPTPGNDGGTSSSDRGTGLTGILDGITAFTGTSLYNRMKSGPLENIIMSAMSVFTPIAELCLYSVGTSYDQCIKILNLQNKEDIRKTFPAFTSSYEGQSKVNFTTPAKVYANENNPLNDTFIKDVVEVFDAETQDMDFSNSILSAKIINAWVEGKTNNRIKDLISSDALSALTQLVLVNAIYFKGPWLNQFNPKNTQKDNFYLNDGTTKKVKLMFQLSYFNYGEVPELNCTVAEMFYEGRNSSMVVVLPNSYDGIITLAKKLQDPVNWNKVRASLAGARVQLYMPPFEIKTTTDLKELLQAVNLGNWFDPKNSELKGITKKPTDVFVSSAIQKAFIKTDETGSEAAAANAIVVGTTSVQPEPKKFRCDHSFLYYILFKNTPIFSGVVVDP